MNGFIKRFAFLLLMLGVVMGTMATSFFCRVHDFAATNGLLEAHMSNAVQDKDGFMWFATWNGLVRYDGYNYYSFKPVKNSGGTISSNRLFNIKKTANDRLWCLSSDNRLYLFDTHSCTFINFHKQVPAMRDKFVKKLVILKKGVTWAIFNDNSCLRIDDHKPFANAQCIRANSKRLGWSKEINTIGQDSMKREWIFTDKAVFLANSKICISGKYKFIVSNKGIVWLITEDGKSVRYDGRSTRELWTGDKSMKVRHVLYAAGKLVLVSSKGTYVVDGSSVKMRKMSDTPADYLYKDSKGRIWAFPKTNGVEIIDIVGNKVQRLSTQFAASKSLMKNPQLIFENGYGRIIVKPQQGLLSYYDEQDEKLHPCRFFNATTPISFMPTEINKFLIDHNKCLWIFQKHKAYCISFQPDCFVFNNSSEKQECRMLGLDQNKRIWAANRSLVLYLTGTDHSQRYLTSSGNWGTAPARFSNQPAYSFMKDNANRLWIGTKGDGLYLLTPRTQGTGYEVEHFVHDAKVSNSLCSDSIYAIYQDRRKRIWLGTYGSGIFCAMETGGKWNFKKVNGFAHDIKVRCFYEPRKNVLLVGTTNGLVAADTRETHHVKCYTNTFCNESWGLKGNDIMSIVGYRDEVYLAVFGSGISRLEGNNYLSDKLHFTTWSISSDATADQIKTAVCDGQMIWIVSDQSITRFSPVKKSLMTFDRSCFTEQVSFSEADPVIKNGFVTVGTMTGTMTFDSRVTSKYMVSEKLVFTGIQYTNDMNIRPLNDIDTLRISPDERSFSLYLSDLDYGRNSPTRFRYKMEGYSDGWSYTSENQHAVNYNNITPGRYNLVVETIGKDGKWGVARRTIPVEVTPKFVETTSFRLFVVLLVIGIIIALVHAIIYLSRIRRALQQKYSLLMTVEELTADIKTEEKLKLKEDDDKKFLDTNIRFLEDHIASKDLSIDDFARHLGMSRTSYYHRMKELTGLSPVEFIKQIRIKKALRLLKNDQLSITEVAYEVGFSDPKYFSRCFKAEMGMAPSAYIHNSEKDKV